jgi:hypothetical protein
VHSSALIDGALALQKSSGRTVAAHLSIGSAGHHHRQSSVVSSRCDTIGHRQDSVLPVVLGLHQSPSAEAELRIQTLFSRTLSFPMFLTGLWFMQLRPEVSCF